MLLISCTFLGNETKIELEHRQNESAFPPVRTKRVQTKDRGNGDTYTVQKDRTLNTRKWLAVLGGKKKHLWDDDDDYFSISCNVDSFQRSCDTVRIYYRTWQRAVCLEKITWFSSVLRYKCLFCNKIMKSWTNTVRQIPSAMAASAKVIDSFIKGGVALTHWPVLFLEVISPLDQSAAVTSWRRVNPHSG